MTRQVITMSAIIRACRVTKLACILSTIGYGASRKGVTTKKSTRNATMGRIRICVNLSMRLSGWLQW